MLNEIIFKSKEQGLEEKFMSNQMMSSRADPDSNTQHLGRYNSVSGGGGGYQTTLIRKGCESSEDGSMAIHFAIFLGNSSETTCFHKQLKQQELGNLKPGFLNSQLVRLPVWMKLEMSKKWQYADIICGGCHAALWDQAQLWMIGQPDRAISWP